MKDKTKICLGVVACSTVMMFSILNEKSQTSKATMISEKSIKRKISKTAPRNRYLKKTVESHTLEKLRQL